MTVSLSRNTIFNVLSRTPFLFGKVCLPQLTSSHQGGPLTWLDYIRSNTERSPLDPQFACS